MTTNKLFKPSALFLCMFLISMISFSANAAEQINKILIKGAQRIAESTVASYMDVKVGDVVDDATTDRALKSLFATGLFADVRIFVKDAALHVEVIENPVINEIAFEGNEKIEDAELIGEVQLRQRQVFTRTKVRSDVARLHQVYRRQGRFSVTIEPKIIQLDQNRVNLVFEIDEGEVTKVKAVRFVGNKKYSDAKLRSVISTKRTIWYRFLSQNDRYDPDRLSFDQELLREYYLSQGYADFQILSAVAELSKDQDSFFITITVDEGERYRFNETEIISQIRNFDLSLIHISEPTRPY